MIAVDIKPLSVNEVWQGKRFKTSKYKVYENAVMWSLPNLNKPEGELSIFIEFSFSNKSSDIDNPVKPFLDILQKKYGFNDRDIYKLSLSKKIVPKGSERIRFNIEAI